MKRIVSITIILAFVFWVVPLGIFIDISLEDILCNGQRAICMCSTNFESSEEGTAAYKKITSKSGYKSPQFDVPHVSFVFNNSHLESRPEFHKLTSKLYVVDIDHVPKLSQIS